MGFKRATIVNCNEVIICFCVGRGVLQTLVEKHFPAPDRNRIHRLLGLDPPRKSDSGKINNNGDADAEAGGSSGKRKPGTTKLCLETNSSEPMHGESFCLKAISLL